MLQLESINHISPFVRKAGHLIARRPLPSFACRQEMGSLKLNSHHNQGKTRAFLSARSRFEKVVHIDTYMNRKKFYGNLGQLNIHTYVKAFSPSRMRHVP